MSKWIDFVADGMASKTKRWRILPKGVTRADAAIGTISWYAPWRRYCLNPHERTVWEEDCLRDVAAFIEAETAAHKEAAKAAKQAGQVQGC